MKIPGERKEGVGNINNSVFALGFGETFITSIIHDYLGRTQCFKGKISELYSIVKFEIKKVILESLDGECRGKKIQT